MEEANRYWLKEEHSVIIKSLEHWVDKCRVMEGRSVRLEKIVEGPNYKEIIEWLGYLEHKKGGTRGDRNEGSKDR